MSIILENKLEQIERNRDELTLIDGCIGIYLYTNKEFLQGFLFPSRIQYRHVRGQLNKNTYADADILIYEEDLSKFLELFKEYAAKYHIGPSVGISRIKHHKFPIERKEPVAYLALIDNTYPEDGSSFD